MTTKSATNTHTFSKKKSGPPSYVMENETLGKGFDPHVTRRYMAFITPYNLKIFQAAVLMAVAALVTVLGPFFLEVAIDDGLTTGSADVLVTMVGLYFASVLVQWVATYYRVRIMMRVGAGVVYDLRTALFTHLQRLSLNFYNRYSVGRVIARIINDVQVVRQFVTWTMLGVFRDVFTLVGILVAMTLMNARLSLLTFTVLPLMVLATVYFRKISQENYRRVRAANSWVNSVLAENINGIRVIQAFAREKFNLNFFKEMVNGYNLKLNLDAQRIVSAFLPTSDLLGSIATAIVIWVGGRYVLQEELTAGTLIAFVLYVERFFGPIRNLSQQFDTFQSTMAGGERIFNLMDAHIEVQDAPDAIELPEIRGEVRFEQVYFKYEDESVPVLKSVDFAIPVGATVALVGETGAGKSTIVKLICRFHDPTQGSVRVDGLDLRSVSQGSLRKQMGIVLQDPFLFDGTVKENIRFGRLSATDEEIQAAAQAVGAHDFIMKLKNGYDTPVNEGGVILSVGQRQLVSFARALLANPRILILDEATSSVDTQTEHIIQEALSKLLKGRTSFVIAHRLSTIVNADLIIVMDKGEIIEMGTHSELLALSGTYEHLYKMGFEEQN